MLARERRALEGAQQTPHNEPTARLTISVRPEVAAYMRARADELGKSVSMFVADSIMLRREIELEAEIVQGLMEDAERDRLVVEAWSGTSPDINE